MERAPRVYLATCKRSGMTVTCDTSLLRGVLVKSNHKGTTSTYTQIRFGFALAGAIVAQNCVC